MKAVAALSLLALAVAGGCGNDTPALTELSGGAMGTRYSIKVKSAADSAALGVLQDEIAELLESVENQMSTYRPESTIGRFNANSSTDWQPVGREFCESIEETLTISQLSGGAFDITIGPLVNLWGFGPDGIVDEPPTDELIQQTRLRVGYVNLETDCSVPAIRKLLPDLYIDLSAYAKGYAVDRIAEHLDRVPVADYLVEVGGELRARGLNASEQPWVVAIESPDPSARRVHSTIPISGQAVATSGDYRNFFEHDGKRYSHTIDSRSGRPVTHSLASVTIVHPSAAMADALATAVHVLGPDEGYRLADREDVAALLLAYSVDGITTRSTPAFDRLVPAS